MKTRFALSLLLAFPTLLLAAADDIGFVEKFALAADREAVLEQLVPGSEEYYFYHALHYQNTRQAEKLRTTLQQWAKRYPSSDQRRIIENREALLGYDANPQATLKYLKDKLNLQFNHQQIARDQKPDLPTKLDQALIAREVFQRRALADHDDLRECSEEALEDFVRQKIALKPEQIRSLLSRLQRPDLPNLVELIAKAMRERESRGFGEYEIHSLLLPDQLDDLAKRVPELLQNQAYVFARLAKLAPGADTDVEYEPSEREAWLERAWAYVSKLPPAFVSLKANVLYQRLQHDRQKGVYDAQRFLAYLQMPRRVGYVNPQYLESPTQQRSGDVDLRADFTKVARILPPIATDEELVRDYFLHLFAQPSPGGKYDADALLKSYLPYVRDTWLKPVLAEAMITAGLGEPEQWASLLSPTAYQKLKERVDIDFARTNPLVHAPDAEVNLDLFIKNAPKVIVKIYEINALSYFLTNAKQLNTDLPLDGLVANREQTYDFSAEAKGKSPFLRTQRNFKFPELKGKRGAWVIEFIGGGRSSRALVRKGQWSLLQRTGPAGELLTVLDEKAAPVPDAVVWLEGRKYSVDAKSGYIQVPFTQQPNTKPIVLADAAGEFATLTTFEHHGESYRLEAQFHIEREQVLAGKQATLVLHPALLLADSQVSLDLLGEVVLTIRSTTLDDIETTSDVKAPKFDAARAFTHVFAVPDRLAQLEVTLTGRVPYLTKGGEQQAVTASHQWSFNGIDSTTATHEGHLSQSADGYFYELLGKNAEPLPDQQVVFNFYHRLFEQAETVALKTDDRGRINLGALADLQKISAEPDQDGETRQWELRDAQRTWPEEIHAKAGDPIQVPLPSGLATDEALPRFVSLVEMRAGTAVADKRDAVKVTTGFLTIEGLASGDYALRLHDETETREIPIHVTAGQLVRNWLVAPNRALEVRESAPLQIAKVDQGAEQFSVQLANWNKWTRVHVAATRFRPDEGFWDLAGFTRFSPTSSTPDRQPSLYAAGRDIGDEYRYILERRYTKTYPGNMLTRPGLLLNPWEVRKTDVHAQEMSAMGRAVGAKGGRAAARQKAQLESESAAKAAIDPGGDESSENLDFLANASPVVLNLTPDEKGLVRFDRKALGDRQFIQIYAEDLNNAVWRTVALPEIATKFRDLRLIRNLDPAKAFTEKKTVTVLGNGQSLTLADILTSEMETYDTIGGVYSLYLTLSGDAKLTKFGWLLQWPTFKDDEKRARYSEFSCHELNVFLWRKDRPFFDKVIRPYLQNKKDKTFLDEFLLEQDLKRWVEPWNYAQLNMAERCFLAQRLPGEAKAAERHLRELWELLPPDTAREDRLFETALRGRALADEDVGGLRQAKMANQNAIDALMFDAPAPSGRANLAKSMPAPAAAMPASTPVPQRAFGVPTVSGAMNMEAGEKAKEARDGKDLYFKADRAADEVLGLEVEELQRQRGQVRPFFRALGPTSEWAENNYYQLRIQEQNAGLITVNLFWHDYAAWDGKTPFLSKNLAEASRSFPEMLLALGVLDLPFDKPKHATKADGGQYTLSAAGSIVAYHKEIQPAAESKNKSELLVSQNFYRQTERYREEGNEKFDKYVSDEFLTGVVYGANVVVTNPTSSPQKLDVLLQIPRGALPVSGSKATQSRHAELAPYTTQTFEYWFYFSQPSPDQPFPHYPVHVARQEQNVGVAAPFTFKVVRQLSQVDTKSWDYVSQYSSNDEVLAFLEANNVQRLPMEKIAWRVRKDIGFFRQLVGFLTAHHLYDDVIYSYSVVHNDAAALGEWLKHRTDFIAANGPYLKSKLLTIDPIERRAYEHLEYSPLVNQRAHRVGAENRIANPVLRGQYQSFLRILSHKAALEPMDEMSVVYYLFAQDRVEEALARFHTVKAESLPTHLQHDYFRCYAALYEENLAEARGIASQYADYTVDKWRKLFVEVSQQLDQIADTKPTLPAVKLENQPDSSVQQSDLAATEPSFSFKVENRQIALTWKNLTSVVVNYYLMEPEFLFSSSPFVTADSTRFSIIKPTKSAPLALPKDKEQMDIPLPPEFAKANVLVEILGAGQRQSQSYHANTFRLTLTENYGRLELREQSANKLVPKAYIKVYARLKNGTVRFFKDGYTDLRGQFDYASLNSSAELSVQPRAAAGEGSSLSYQMLRPDELGQVEKMAILILHDAYGALVREVNPPAGSQASTAALPE